VPCGPIYTAREITRDAQYAARDMIQRFDVSNGDEVLPNVGFPGVVPVIGGKSLPVRTLGPDLGEHTQQVLGGLLGLTPAEIDGDWEKAS
jgi:formyl-CoA transferase